jgi:hypothetical protein
MEQALISPSIEQFTKQAIFMDLSKGDPLWDVPHTTAVVHHLKQILKASPDLKEVNSAVAIIAAYGHDWGYSAFYKSGQSLTKEEYMEAKKTHAEIACKKMGDLLNNDIYLELNQKQKDRILHLILVHDQLDILKDKDELVLMEADTLGGLDTDFVTSNWTKEQNIRHLEVVRERRLPKFITQWGKTEFEKCFVKRMNAKP